MTMISKNKIWGCCNECSGRKKTHLGFCINHDCPCHQPTPKPKLEQVLPDVVPSNRAKEAHLLGQEEMLGSTPDKGGKQHLGELASTKIGTLNNMLENNWEISTPKPPAKCPECQAEPYNDGGENHMFHCSKNKLTPNMTDKTKEFPEGKESYCPECYFVDEKVVLRKNCPGHKTPPEVSLSGGLENLPENSVTISANQPADTEWEDKMATIIREWYLENPTITGQEIWMLHPRLVDFISSLLQSQRSAILGELKEAVKNMKRKHCGRPDCSQGQCLNRHIKDETLTEILEVIERKDQ